MRLIAPAKINWTLDVLGRRDDGYHEVRTVLQTIDLFDDVCLDPAETLTIAAGSGYSPSEDDLALAAARLLAEVADRPPRATISIAKRIPATAGLGGGSSNAAAVLRGLNLKWGVAWEPGRLSQVAARLGSDVPFFLYGGTALAQGRGELITPLPDSATAWLVLLVPPFKPSHKTKRMYQALTPTDFSDGSHTEALVSRLRQGGHINDACLYNVFERAAYETFAGLTAYREALLAAGAPHVHLAGSGPALFALATDRSEAEEIYRSLRPPGGEFFLARTVAAHEALAIED